MTPVVGFARRCLGVSLLGTPSMGIPPSCLCEATGEALPAVIPSAALYEWFIPRDEYCLADNVLSALRVHLGGDQRELYLSEEQPGEEPPYERLLGDAMIGDGALFTRKDAVEAAWAVLDPVLKKHHRVRPYKRKSWGPKQADAIIASDGGWHNPSPKDASSS